MDDARLAAEAALDRSLPAYSADAATAAAVVAASLPTPTMTAVSPVLSRENYLLFRTALDVEGTIHPPHMPFALPISSLFDDDGGRFVPGVYQEQVITVPAMDTAGFGLGISLGPDAGFGGLPGSTQAAFQPSPTYLWQLRQMQMQRQQQQLLYQLAHPQHLQQALPFPQLHQAQLAQHSNNSDAAALADAAAAGTLLSPSLTDDAMSTTSAPTTTAAAAATPMNLRLSPQQTRAAAPAPTVLDLDAQHRKLALQFGEPFAESLSLPPPPLPQQQWQAMTPSSSTSTTAAGTITADPRSLFGSFPAVVVPAGDNSNGAGTADTPRTPSAAKSTPATPRRKRSAAAPGRRTSKAAAAAAATASRRGTSGAPATPATPTASSTAADAPCTETPATTADETRTDQTDASATSSAEVLPELKPPTSLIAGLAMVPAVKKKQQLQAAPAPAAASKPPSSRRSMPTAASFRNLERTASPHAGSFHSFPCTPLAATTSPAPAPVSAPLVSAPTYGSALAFPTAGPGFGFAAYPFMPSPASAPSSASALASASTPTPSTSTIPMTTTTQFVAVDPNAFRRRPPPPQQREHDGPLSLPSPGGTAPAAAGSTGATEGTAVAKPPPRKRNRVGSAAGRAKPARAAQPTKAKPIKEEPVKMEEPAAPTSSPFMLAASVPSAAPPPPPSPSPPSLSLSENSAPPPPAPPLPWSFVYQQQQQQQGTEKTKIKKEEEDTNNISATEPVEHLPIDNATVTIGAMGEQLHRDQTSMKDLSSNGAADADAQDAYALAFAKAWEEANNNSSDNDEAGDDDHSADATEEVALSPWQLQEQQQPLPVAMALESVAQSRWNITTPATEPHARIRRRPQTRRRDGDLAGGGGFSFDKSDKEGGTELMGNRSVKRGWEELVGEHPQDMHLPTVPASTGPLEPPKGV